MLSTDTHLALHPRATYAALLATGVDGRWSTFGLRVAHVTVLNAILAGTAVTQRASLGTAAGALGAAVFATFIQLLVSAAVILPFRSRTSPASAAFSLFWAAHLPWSLWVVATMSWAIIAGPSFSLYNAVVSAVIASGWTAVLVTAFGQVVLGLTARHARLLATAHLLLVWTIVLSYIAWASGGWFQLLP